MTELTPAKDLGAVFDAHVKAEFVDMDVAATMATMTPEPYLTHVPTLTGGTGTAEVECFYRDHFVGHWPDDVQVKSVSRTVGQNRVVDELIGNARLSSRPDADRSQGCATACRGDGL